MKTTVTNPIFWADVPDVDVIRVGSSFYMISTSMHTMPGCPIMKSENLANWEIIGYVYDQIESNDAYHLVDGKNNYGQGQWATSLRYHNGIFYLCFSCNDTQKFYVYRTTDIESGDWQRSTIDGLYHDPALLFDNDRVFVISGCGDIRITELTKDLTAVKSDGVNQLLLETERQGIGLRCEGCHAYKIDGYYYLIFIEWPTEGKQRRRQIAYRSKDLFGDYERKIIFDDDMGYQNQGIAQGAIFDTAAGDWYAMLFQDHGAVGRIPYVLPVQWIDGWPMVGINGKAPESFIVNLPETKDKPLVVSDEFNYQENLIGESWQWNHNPDHTLWSFTERPGYLRLTTGQLTDHVLQARNTLTQRTEGPTCTAITRMDTTDMKSGDHAGLIALQSNFGTVGVQVNPDGEKSLTMTTKDGVIETIIEEKLNATNIIDLKIEFNFVDSIDLARFYYSTTGDEWIEIGEALQMKYTLDHFMGYRVGLFNYATTETGGSVDFDYFRYLKANKLIQPNPDNTF
ncbi:MAG TPA: glycosyl hydrolase 43 family protein [Bacilli bacterium]|nr:glycosyl hydrolase 43 family protein [Bacilli bacterium]